MNSVVRLSRGDMDGVVDTLDGLDPRKKWISDDVDKKYNSYDQLNDGKECEHGVFYCSLLPTPPPLQIIPEQFSGYQRQSLLVVSLAFMNPIMSGYRNLSTLIGR